MRRPTVRGALRAGLLLAALLWVPWAIAWAFDLDGVSWLVPSALAFLPYAAAATLVVLIAAVLARARTAAVVAVIGLAVLVVPRIGRLTADPQPRAGGPSITVATANLRLGNASVPALEQLIREHRVDVLLVQENTRRWDPRAARSGLADLLPNHLTIPDREGGAAGLALWSRWPVQPADLPGDAERTLGGTLRVPGAAPLALRSAHPFPPFSAQNLPCWRRCTRALGTLARGGADAIVGGDFNASLDHHPLRDLLADGFRDASEQRGLAMRPTWSNGSWGHLTLDHILVTRGIAVEQVTAHDLPSSDHDVLVARLRLPR